MHIVSLLPSATEIVCALGRQENLVGRSHECDYPESVQDLPACTIPKYDADGTSYETDQRIKAIVQEGLSVYRVDADLLAGLKPDVILTQDHCEVCAASLDDVKEAVEQHLDDSVQILSVSPKNLDEVFLSIRQIAESINAEQEGINLIIKMINKLNMLQSRTRSLPSPTVVCIEWIDPLMSSGNWFPELVNIAGGKALLARAGEHSPWIEWEEVVDVDPDLLLVSPCGYDLNKTKNEIRELTGNKGWKKLQAKKNERVFLMNGDQYFHRPGPRLVDSAEILAEIFHPGIFEPALHSGSWINLAEL